MKVPTAESSNVEPEKPDPAIAVENFHPRFPQYTKKEIQNGIAAIQLLILVRDRCRAQGLIDW